MTPARGSLHTFADPDALAEGAAAFLCDQAERSHDRFMLALSGGSTPKRLYERLAASPFVKRFPWSRTQFVIGDERFVPPDHPDSNFRMVREAMFSHAPVPPGNIHPVPTEGLDADAAADAYDRTLRHLYGADALEADKPLFDVCLLGLGEDGHTASLIPGQPVLHEHAKWVAAVPAGRSEVRITLTYPALESSHVTIFLVEGEKKREILDRMLSGDRSVPAGMLRPAGELLWFADRAAAGRWAG
jgi:6-phosphogluconolactonase